MNMARTILRPLLICCVLLTGTGKLEGQTTDVAQKVGNLLQQYGPVAVTTIVNQKHDRMRCTGGHGEGAGCHNEGYTVQVPVTNQQVLTATNIHVIKSTDIVFGTPQRTELPEDLYITDFLAQSCSGGPPLTENQTLTRTFSRTTSIQIQRSITNTSGSSANISFQYKVGGSAFTIGGQIQNSSSTTTATATVDSDQQTVTRTATVSATVPTNSAAVLELMVWPVHFVVPFSTTVTVDADLSTNDQKLSQLSQIYPDESVRTFDISGTLQANDASGGKAVIYSVPPDPSQCPAGTQYVERTNYVTPPTTEVTDYVPPTPPKKMKGRGPKKP
jgi:hypothetical protein